MLPGADIGVAAPGRLADNLVELLTVTQRRIARGVSAALAEDGATLDSYRLLRCLAAGNGRSMGQLVAALHLPAPTLTRLVDAAVDAALAYRLPDPADGRKVVVHVSDVGRTRLSRLEALVHAHESALAASVGPDRVAALVQALTELAAAEGAPEA
jgi:DNA-binding MarR family transcriptional regulator